MPKLTQLKEISGDAYTDEMDTAVSSGMGSNFVFRDRGMTKIGSFPARPSRDIPIEAESQA